MSVPVLLGSDRSTDGFQYTVVYDLAFVDVDAQVEGGIIQASLVAELSQLHGIRHGGIGEGAGGSPRYGTGDVGDAVVHNAVDFVDRL